MDITNTTEWPDERVTAWVLAQRKAGYLGSWKTKHLELFENEARHRNLKIP